MRPFTLSFICSLVIFTIPTTAILAVASGKCAGVCGNVTTTQASDIVCTDSDYANTPTGQAFENCINCEMNSSAVDPYTGDTDLKWLLYNLRFAMSACLWDYPNNTIVQDTPCITSRACGPFQPNIQFNNLSTTVNTYDYCGNFSTYQEANCAGCLKQLGSDSYLANFFAVLSTGCQFQTGSLIPLAGSIFSGAPVTIASPTPSSSVKSTPPGALSLGAKVGIVISGLLFLLGVAGFTIVWCGKRRRRANLAEYAKRQTEYTGSGGRRPLGGHVSTAWVPHSGGGEGQDESPATAGGYGSDKHGFSPYSSRYSSPVSARDGLAASQSWDQYQPNMSAVNDGLRMHDEAFELEKMRNHRVQEKTIVDEGRLHEDWMNEAAQRGFTTAPIIKLPDRPGAAHR